MKKILLLVVAIVCIIGIGLFAYFQFFSPESRAKSSSENYMKALLAGDTQEAKRLYSAQDPMSEVLQRNYRLVSVVKDADIYYMRYTFADNKEPSIIRIAIDGDVIKDIKTGEHLGDVPAADTPEDAEQTVGGSRCLAKSDLAYIDSVSIYARNIRGATMIFPSGSTDYIATADSKSLLDRAANFYKKAYEKDFVFELKGYRQSAGLGEEENEQLNSLFQRRAVILQKDLTERGIPLDRVLINNKYNYYAPSTTSESGQYIDINIVNRCIKT